MNTEKRSFNFELRAGNRGGSPVLRGVAAVFNSMSDDLGGFRECIAPGAFRLAIASSDVRALVNHDPNLVLGRTASGTLKLEETDEGLEFEVELPDTTYARDLMACMQRGDINQCSFAFSVGEDGQSWEHDGAMWTRTVNVVSRLYDVSPVTYPAYQDTSCAMRSLEKVKQDKTEIFQDTGALDMMRLRLELEELD